MNHQAHTFPLTADYTPQVGDVIAREQPNRRMWLKIVSINGDEVTVECSWERGEVTLSDFSQKVAASVADALKFGADLTVTRQGPASEPPAPVIVTCPHCGQAMPEKIEVQK